MLTVVNGKEHMTCACVWYKCFKDSLNNFERFSILQIYVKLLYVDLIGKIKKGCQNEILYKVIPTMLILMYGVRTEFSHKETLAVFEQMKLDY